MFVSQSCTSETAQKSHIPISVFFLRAELCRSHSSIAFQLNVVTMLAHQYRPGGRFVAGEIGCARTCHKQPCYWRSIMDWAIKSVFTLTCPIMLTFPRKRVSLTMSWSVLHCPVAGPDDWVGCLSSGLCTYSATNCSNA